MRKFIIIALCCFFGINSWSQCCKNGKSVPCSTNGSGPCPKGTTVTGTGEAPTTTNYEDTRRRIVFVNPVESNLEVVLQHCEGCINPNMIGFEIYDSNSNLILNINIPPATTHSIDVSTLPPGNYYLEVYVDVNYQIEVNGQIEMTNMFVKPFIKN